jgi:Protein of unknown function (DUF2809)
MGLGLLSRSQWLPRGSFIAEFAGDTLWAAMVYFGVALLMPKFRPQILAIYALIFAFAIEFSQLLEWPWIVQLRSDPFARLILGRGFLWTDLLCYTVGVLLAKLADHGGRRLRRSAKRL